MASEAQGGAANIAKMIVGFLRQLFLFHFCLEMNALSRSLSLI